jgi:hypothetical protein
MLKLLNPLAVVALRQRKSINVKYKEEYFCLLLIGNKVKQIKLTTIPESYFLIN